MDIRSGGEGLPLSAHDGKAQLPGILGPQESFSPEAVLASLGVVLTLASLYG